MRAILRQIKLGVLRCYGLRLADYSRERVILEHNDQSGPNQVLLSAQHLLNLDKVVTHECHKTIKQIKRNSKLICELSKKSAFNCKVNV